MPRINCNIKDNNYVLTYYQAAADSPYSGEGVLYINKPIRFSFSVINNIPAIYVSSEIETYILNAIQRSILAVVKNWV